MAMLSDTANLRKEPMQFNSVDQAQKLARRRVPRSVYRFIEGGTDAEVTVAANRAAFAAWLTGTPTP